MRNRTLIVVWIVWTASVVLISACVGMFAGYFWGQSKMLEHLEANKRDILAQQFGVESNWEAIRKHIYCNILKPGKGLSEVQEELGVLAPFSWGEAYNHVEIFFKDHIINKRIGRLAVYFDESKRITSVYKMVGIGDMVRLDDKCER
nr:hypothetical protein [Ardenticatena sp.]